MLSLIATLDEKRGIEKSGKSPWTIAEDLQRFETLTKGHTVIMGAHRFESFAKQLTHNKIIVVTQDPNFHAENVTIVNSIDDALDAAGANAFVIGGAQIFNETIDLADKLYLTQIVGDFGCDSFFPDFTLFTNETFIGAGEENGTRYKFLELTK
jgi:dihydrofolate reductase